MIKRRNPVEVHLNAVEIGALDKLAGEAGVTIEAYLRKVVVSHLIAAVRGEDFDQSRVSYR